MASQNPVGEQPITKREIKIKWGEEEQTKEVYLGNDKDLLMVLSVLQWISEDERQNIVKYLLDAVKKCGVKKAHCELDAIYGIGDKIAASVIRDFGLMNFAVIPKEDRRCAFPVDTWVSKIAQKMGCQQHKEPEKVKDFFLQRCDDFNIDSLKLAAGVWYLGFNSLDILLKSLGQIDIEEFIAKAGGESQIVPLSCVD